MENKYLELFGLYKKSPVLFISTVEKIGIEKFDYKIVLKILESGSSSIENGVRRLLLEYFPYKIEYTVLLSFMNSDDEAVRSKTWSLIQWYDAQDKNLLAEADRIARMFT